MNTIRTDIRKNNPISQYFGNLKSIFTGPSRFYRNLTLPQGFAGPLFFGVLTSWIASALEYLWYTGLGRVFSDRISDLLTAFEKVPQIDTSGQFETALEMRQKVIDWVFGVGSILTDPFRSLLSILFVSFWIWLAARLFAPIDSPDAKTRLRFETAVTIVSFAQAATLFRGIPMLGGMFSSLFVAIFTVLGVTEIYRVGTGRAILITLFPMILLWTLLIGALIALLAGVAFVFMQ